jgi:ankyrin repeat protein
VARLLAAGVDPNASMSGPAGPSGEMIRKTALVAAAGLGQLEAARLLLEAGADPGRADSDGVTPLIVTAMNGELEVLRLLLGRGAAVDAATPDNGFTAFHYACFRNQPECAEALARVGCDVGRKDIDGRTGREVAEEKGHAALVALLRALEAKRPRAAQAAVGPGPESAETDSSGDALGRRLQDAAAQGNGAAVARLLAAGADPNASTAARAPSGEVIQTTMLMTGAVHGHLEVVRLLLEAGAEPGLTDSDGATPLMAAAGAGQLEVLRLLLARGAAVDAVLVRSGATAFSQACYHNHPECAEALARAGCDVGLKDVHRMTGRQLAEAKGHAAVVERLRLVVAEQLRAVQVAGPEPEPAGAGGGPLEQLYVAAQDGDGPTVRRLLAAGADPNASVAARTPAGEITQITALMAAAVHGRLEVARLLLEGGVDPSPIDSDGNTPLMAAAGGGHPEVVRLLLARGAVVDAVQPGTGGTAFHFACYNNEPDCVEALARAGCDVGLKNANGTTGRQLAEAEGHTGVVERLRLVVVTEQLRAAQAAGPEPEPAGAGGWTLAEQLYLAAQDGDGPAVARLLAAGADPNASVAQRTPSGEVFQPTVLVAAAGNGRLEAVRLLLEAGADPSRAGSEGYTLGISEGYTPCPGCPGRLSGLSVSHSKSVLYGTFVWALNNQKPRFPARAVMIAALDGQLAVLRLLLARGAAVDAAATATGTRAFHLACDNIQAECAEALVRAGCDVGIKDNDGETGQQLAKREGRTAVVQRLQALEAERPPAGAVAQIHGLVGAPEHNGQRAAVRRHLPVKGRYELELLESGQKVHVKSANFELVIVPVGLAVEVHGLVGAVEHNGKKGVVESRVGENGRCGVRLQGRTTPLGLRPVNLQPASQAVALELEPAGASSAGGGALEQQLYVAVDEDDGPAVVRLLAAGADPNASVPMWTASGDMVQSTALAVAAEHGRLEVVRLLLEGGADPSCADSNGTTALMLAARIDGQPEVLRLLLVRGAAVDAVRPGDGGTAFHSACYFNQPDCAEALARAGCDVGLKTKNGETGRQLAERQGHMAVVARLRTVVSEQLRVAQAAARVAPEPAEVGGQGQADELLTAAGEGDGAVMARLLAAGADPNALLNVQTPAGENYTGFTALMGAVGHGRLEAVRLLLEAGADPSLTPSTGGTPLMVAAGQGQLEMLRLLLEWGAGMDAAGPGDGATAFHMACVSNHPECAEILARAGCDVSLKTTRGARRMTGREIAEEMGHTAVVQRLRAVVSEQLHELRKAQAAARAAPGSRTRGPPQGTVCRGTALAAAVEHGRLEAVRLLLDGGADPSCAAGDGTTPLMQAAGKGHLEVLQLLQGRGAAVDAVDPRAGRTAVQLAGLCNQAECAEALMRVGCDVGIKDLNGMTGREVAEANGHDTLAARLRALEAEQLALVVAAVAAVAGVVASGGGGTPGGGGGAGGGGGGGGGGGTSGAKKKRKKRPKKKRVAEPAAEPAPAPALQPQPEPRKVEPEPEEDADAVPEPEPEPEAPDELELDDPEPQPEAPSGPMAEFDEAAVLAWLAAVPGLTATQRAAALERVEYDGEELAAVKPKRLLKLLKGSEAEGAVPLLLAARDALLAAEEAARTTAVPEPAPVAAPAERPSCSICMEPYSAAGGVVPRMLVACGHDFCEGCLDAMLRCAGPVVGRGHVSLLTNLDTRRSKPFTLSRTVRSRLHIDHSAAPACRGCGSAARLRDRAWPCAQAAGSQEGPEAAAVPVVPDGVRGEGRGSPFPSSVITAQSTPRVITSNLLAFPIN